MPNAACSAVHAFHTSDSCRSCLECSNRVAEGGSCCKCSIRIVAGHSRYTRTPRSSHGVFDQPQGPVYQFRTTSNTQDKWCSQLLHTGQSPAVVPHNVSCHRCSSYAHSSYNHGMLCALGHAHSNSSQPAVVPQQDGIQALSQ
jgi:hypothetical protein